MNEQRLARLFRTLALGSLPLSMVGTGVACGTSSPGGGQEQDASRADGGPGGDDAGSTYDGASTSSDAGSDAPFDPCAPFSGFPGCGGGQNFCATPDAGVGALDGGGEYFGEACAPFCGESPGSFSCQVVLNADAQQVVRCSMPCLGRLPAGLCAGAGEADADLPVYLAEVAFLEAASIAAFRSLRRELRHHGAPPSILRAATRAAREEVRHARIMGGIARRHGARLRKPRIEAPPVRSLVEIAAENVVEGCVRETFGALIATYQARAAADVEMRAAMKDIARDETSHAALAWKVAAWIDRKLSASEREQVAAARREAIQRLAREVAVTVVPPAVQRLAGLPARSDAARMVDSLRMQLWRT